MTPPRIRPSATVGGPAETAPKDQAGPRDVVTGEGGYPEQWSVTRLDAERRRRIPPQEPRTVGRPTSTRQSQDLNAVHKTGSRTQLSSPRPVRRCPRHRPTADGPRPHRRGQPER